MIEINIVHHKPFPLVSAKPWFDVRLDGRYVAGSRRPYCCGETEAQAANEARRLASSVAEALKMTGAAVKFTAEPVAMGHFLQKAEDASCE